MLKPKYLITSLIIIALIASYLTFYKQQDTQIKQEIKTMDYNNIPLAQLPHDQLFTYEQAMELKKKAFYEGFPTILDEQAMLKLTKHAYQYDKNAMIAYAQIIEAFKTGVSDDDAITLADFLKKYSYELVDAKGKPLQTPAIFDLEYQDFLKVLANKGYIQPAILIVQYMPSSLEDEAIRKEAIHYLRFLNNNGERYYIALANTLLFKIGMGTIDSFSDEPNPLINHISTISEDEIKEAIENYRIASLHGNNYAMTRLAEVYYYGIGKDVDYITALAWTELANKGYEYILHFSAMRPNTYFDKHGELAINQFNLDLASQIKQHLNDEQINQANKLAEELKQTIVTWDFHTWSNNVIIPIQP